jgi:hypothetical protein
LLDCYHYYINALTELETLCQSGSDKQQQQERYQTPPDHNDLPKQPLVLIWLVLSKKKNQERSLLSSAAKKA